LDALLRHQLRRRSRRPDRLEHDSEAVAAGSELRQHIVAVLEEVRWRIRGEGGAAQRLGLKPSTLEFRMRELGIRL